MRIVKKIAVVGPGLMGSGIAASFAHGGYEVALIGRSEERLNEAFARIKRYLRTLHDADLIDDEARVFGLIRGFVDLEDGLRGADFVIEAVPEDMSVKKKTFQEVNRICPENVIFATNTSGLSITEMATAVSSPGRFLGTHFWNPPHLVPLVEVVKGEKTREDVVEAVLDVLRRIRKEPVLVNKDIPGFIGTRLHQALIREAFYIVEQGVATVEDVDRVVKASFGRRLAVTGPFETCDLGGLDVFLQVAEQWRHLSNAQEPSGLLKKMVASGNLGAKTGKGFYVWDKEALEKVERERETVLIYFLKKEGRCIESA